MSLKEELFDRLRFAVSHLPIDKFVTVDIDGACYVDWDKIDAADFKDNAVAFTKAMCQIKCVQMTEGYDTPNIPLCVTTHSKGDKPR